MVTLCLKCGHDIGSHKIEILGNYEYVEINCQEEGNEYSERCNCDAGFKKVAIKKEFNQMG